MSAGCVHREASVALAGGFLLGSLAFGSGWEYAIGSLVGILLSPDLDVDRGNVSNQVIRETVAWATYRFVGKKVSWRLGELAEKPWDAFWFMYRRSLKHGGDLSHFPVISTFGRLGYIFFFALVIPYLLLWWLFPGAWSIRDELMWWIALGAKHYKIILGLMGSDFIHWGLDILTTEKTNGSNKRRNQCPKISRAVWSWGR